MSWSGSRRHEPVGAPNRSGASARRKHMDLVALASTLVMDLSARGGSAELVAQSEGAVEVPGGVTDGVGKVLYVTGAQFGVVAVDAVSGDVLWECADAFRPLVLVDH